MNLFIEIFRLVLVHGWCYADNKLVSFKEMISLLRYSRLEQLYELVRSADTVSLYCGLGASVTYITNLRKLLID